MQNRPFLNKYKKPEDQSLSEKLGGAKTFYDNLRSITEAYKKVWNHSPSSGWMLKVSDTKKALFYLIPLNKSFNISMAIRETEKIAILQKDNLSQYHQLTAEATRSSEGYHIQYEVTDVNSYSYIKSFIELIISQR